MQYNDAEDLLASFSRWQVFLCHGKINTEQFHYQVLLNNDFFETWEMIYLSVSTSNIEWRERFLELKWLDRRTLVIVEVWEVDFLSKRSCFNCNDIYSCNIHQLYWEYLEWNFRYVWDLPDIIMEKILNWIKISKMVSAYDKKAIWVV